MKNKFKTALNWIKLGLKSYKNHIKIISIIYFFYYLFSLVPIGSPTNKIYFFITTPIYLFLVLPLIHTILTFTIHFIRVNNTLPDKQLIHSWLKDYKKILKYNIKIILMFFVSFLAFIIPGIIVFIRYGFYVYAMFDTNIPKDKNLLEHSKEITNKKGLLIFITALIPLIIHSIIIFILQKLIPFANSSFISKAILNLYIYMIFSPILTMVFSHVYSDLKKEYLNTTKEDTIEVTQN